MNQKTMKPVHAPQHQLKRVFSAQELNTEPRIPDEDLIDVDKIKDQIKEARGDKITKDIIVKKNKVVNSKNIPSHLKTYVHALKSGL